MALISLVAWIYFYIELENMNTFFKIWLSNHAHLLTTSYHVPQAQGLFCENLQFCAI